VLVAEPRDPDDRREPLAGPANRVLGLLENVLYALAGVVLAASAAAMLVTAVYHLVKDLSSGTEHAVTAVVDALLLVFILLELMAAVRATITERRLVAEPFLIVGIIASIKEIVVIAVEADETRGRDSAAFDDAMLQIGLLGVIVLLLAAASFLVRRKEREPAEE
jgi:uncharacterized membrane protein (DUF373 family)